MNSKKIYISPDMEVGVFEIEDIIRTSGDIDEGEVDITKLNI